MERTVRPADRRTDGGAGRGGTGLRRKANDVFPSDGQKLALRREYLLRCHAAAKALGERMDTKCCGPTPEGAFRNGKGITLNAEAALKSCTGWKRM